jgi:hypothetical protein
MNAQQQTPRKRAKLWPLVAIGLILVAGFIYWDFTAHRWELQQSP